MKFITVILCFISTFISNKAQVIVLRRLSTQDCERNPCLNGGKCIPGKFGCECAFGWMGKYCHRSCRNIYKTCDRWAEEGKCAITKTQTNFFDLNCAVSCNVCTPDTEQVMSDIPVPPSLEPLLFMKGVWFSLSNRRYRYPADMYSNRYEEILNIMPAEVPMFGAPSFNYTSICKSNNDTRITVGFITVKLYSRPVEIAILSSDNEGINIVELGTLKDGMATFNMTYLQVHSAVDDGVLPLGATRRFRRVGDKLEMTAVKLFPGHRTVEFKKTFIKLHDYPI